MQRALTAASYGALCPVQVAGLLHIITSSGSASTPSHADAHQHQHQQGRASTGIIRDAGAPAPGHADSAYSLHSSLATNTVDGGSLGSDGVAGLPHDFRARIDALANFRTFMAVCVWGVLVGRGGVGRADGGVPGLRG